MTEDADWKRLERELIRLFKSNGAVGGGSGYALLEAELACGMHATQTYVGYQILCDSFKAFCFETFKALQVPPTRSFAYANHVARLSSLFKQLRASELLLLNGYPWQGYSLLRVIVEQAQIRLAVVQGLYSDHDVEGLTEGEVPETFNDVLGKKKKVEWEIFRRITGTKSGLSEESINRLKKWDDMFDHEIHGFRFSSIETLEWLKGEGGLPILPMHSDSGATMYVNRYPEVAWMLHRLIPLLQLRPHSLSKEWAEKWRALDNSFAAFSKGLAGIGRPIGLAIIELVTKKFPFDVSTHFPDEPIKSGATGDDVKALLEARFNRWKLSEFDFDEAFKYLEQMTPEMHEHVRRGLLSAAIVAYARPFKRSYGSEKAIQLIRLPEGFLGLSEQSLHDRVLKLRDSGIAHSDFELKPTGRVATGLSSGFMTWSKPFNPLDDITDWQAFRSLAWRLYCHCYNELREIDGQLRAFEEMPQEAADIKSTVGEPGDIVKSVVIPLSEFMPKKSDS